MALVELTSVRKRYGKGAAAVEALRGVDLAVEEGEFVAVLGRSGSGKSTLMNLVAGLDRADEGAVCVAGEDLGRLPGPALARHRGRRIGIVFQSFHLLPGRSALENVEMPLKIDGVPRAERRRRAAETLDRVGLAPRATHRPAELSGGEQQRVAVARALVRDPALLLCDEPTGNLDSATADEVSSLLSRIHREMGRTVLLITHERDLADRLADRIVTLADGRVESVEAPQR